MPSVERNKGEPAAGRKRAKWALLVLVAGVAGGLFWRYGHLLSLDRLAFQETRLREYQQAHPLAVFVGAFLIYVAVTGLSLPGATVLSLLYGWYFGFWAALVLVSCSSTAGATLAFLFSRFLFRDAVVAHFGERLRKFNQSLEREGAFFLFGLRLIPAVPFFVINAVMGVTPLRTSTFWWVSQLGMLPGTAIYVYAGSVVPSLPVLAEQGVQAVFSPRQLTQLLIAFVILGCFPLLARRIWTWLKHRRRPASESGPDAPPAP
jgi:uncharacterized membrane protein YdjX (TVP38/TMEM64 family)